MRWNLGGIEVTEDAFALLTNLSIPLVWFLSSHGRHAPANYGTSAFSAFEVGPGQGLFVFTLVRAGLPNTTLVYTSQDDVWSWKSQAEQVSFLGGTDANADSA